MNQHAWALGVLPRLQQKLTSDNPVAGSNFGLSTAITPNGLRAVVGCTGGKYVAVFDRIESGWTQVATLQVSESDDTRQGWRVSISEDGNTVVSAAPFALSYEGALYVFQNVSGVWQNTGTLREATHGVTSQLCIQGLGLSLDGTTVACTRETVDADIGGVAVFVRTGATTWLQQGALIMPPTVNTQHALEGRGISFAHNGSIMAFGAPSDNGNNGTVFVYKRDSSLNWNPLTSMKVTSTVNFGSFVVMSADASTIIAGNNLGTIYVFTFNGSGGYVQVQQLTNSDASNVFGDAAALSASGQRLIVGDRIQNKVTTPTTYAYGGAFIYDRLPNGFVRVNGIVDAIDNTTQGTEDLSYFGAYGVGVSDENHFIIGAFGDNSRTGSFNSSSVFECSRLTLRLGRCGIRLRGSTSYFHSYSCPFLLDIVSHSELQHKTRWIDSDDVHVDDVGSSTLDLTTGFKGNDQRSFRILIFNYVSSFLALAPTMVLESFLPFDDC